MHWFVHLRAVVAPARATRAPPAARRVLTCSSVKAESAGSNPVVSAPLPACLHPGRLRRPRHAGASFSLPARRASAGPVLFMERGRVMVMLRGAPSLTREELIGVAEVEPRPHLETV